MDISTNAYNTLLKSHKIYTVAIHSTLHYRRCRLLITHTHTETCSHTHTVKRVLVWLDAVLKKKVKRVFNSVQTWTLLYKYPFRRQCKIFLYPCERAAPRHDVTTGVKSSALTFSFLSQNQGSSSCTIWSQWAPRKQTDDVYIHKRVFFLSHLSFEMSFCRTRTGYWIPRNKHMANTIAKSWGGQKKKKKQQTSKKQSFSHFSFF